MPGQKKKSTGKKYEILTQGVFQKIIDQHFVKTVEVKHNVILKGKTTNHQIDVFWEYEISGILYQTLVQTKDWASAVKQEQLLTFKAVLDDLPGQPRGVFVTKTGYQSGALEVAEKNGIVLYELRKPGQIDFSGQIGTIAIEMQLSGYRFENLNVKMDEDWVRNELSKINHKGPYTFPISGRYDQMMLYDENDSEIGTFSDILSSENIGENSSLVISKKFDNAFIITPSEKIKKVKISEITCLVTSPAAISNFEIYLDGMVEFILKNVHKNDVTYIFG